MLDGISDQIPTQPTVHTHPEAHPAWCEPTLCELDAETGAPLRHVASTKAFAPHYVIAEGSHPVTKHSQVTLGQWHDERAMHLRIDEWIGNDLRTVELPWEQGLTYADALERQMTELRRMAATAAGLAPTTMGAAVGF